MKKKILFTALSLSLMVTLSACNSSSDVKDNDKAENKKQEAKYENIKGEMDESVSPEFRNQISKNLDGKMIDFKAKSMSGEEIDNSIFKESDITIVNVWGAESEERQDLKALKSLYEEVKEKNINVLGIVSSEKEIENAKKMVEKNGVEFTNIISDENLNSNLLSKVAGVPTTFFVDSEGKIVGDNILGPVSVENYKKALEVAIKHSKQ